MYPGYVKPRTPDCEENFEVEQESVIRTLFVNNSSFSWTCSRDTQFWKWTSLLDILGKI
jgi:hypothetical protein